MATELSKGGEKRYNPTVLYPAKLSSIKVTKHFKHIITYWWKHPGKISIKVRVILKGALIYPFLRIYEGYTPSKAGRPKKDKDTMERKI